MSSSKKINLEKNWPTYFVVIALIFFVGYFAFDYYQGRKRISRLTNTAERVEELTLMLNRYGVLKSLPNKSLSQIDEFSELRKRIDKMMKDEPDSIREEWERIR